MKDPTGPLDRAAGERMVGHTVGAGCTGNRHRPNLLPQSTFSQPAVISVEHRFRAAPARISPCRKTPRPPESSRTRIHTIPRYRDMTGATTKAGFAILALYVANAAGEESIRMRDQVPPELSQSLCQYEMALILG